MLFHVLNRAVGRGRIFNKAADYQAFEKVVAEVHGRLPTRLLSYVLLPNHFHLVLWPRHDRELSEFMRLLTVTHTQRWHAHRHSAGTGPLYQGRFKSFPIERDDAPLLTVLRYVERSPVRAKLVGRAELWRWGAPGKRQEPQADQRTPWLMRPDDWPIETPPRNWLARVNRPQSERDEQAVAESIRRGRPFGSGPWQRTTARKLALESTLRPRGRPRVRPIKDSRPL